MPEALPQKRDYTAERDAAVVPVARELIRRIAARSEDLIMGSVGVSEENAAVLARTMYQEDVVPLLLEHNLKLNEIPYLFSIMLQPMNFLNDMTTASIEQNRDLADAKKYGIADIEDLRVSDLEATLRAPVDNSAQA